MTEKVKTELDRIVDTLVQTGIVTKIILFGSCARGEETEDSDIDLCVLMPKKDSEDGERLIDVTVSLRRKLIDVRDRPLDLLTYNQDDFSKYADRPRSFEYHIMKQGVVLYG